MLYAYIHIRMTVLLYRVSGIQNSNMRIISLIRVPSRNSDSRTPWPLWLSQSAITVRIDVRHCRTDKVILGVVYLALHNRACLRSTSTHSSHTGPHRHFIPSLSYCTIERKARQCRRAANLQLFTQRQPVLPKQSITTTLACVSGLLCLCGINVLCLLTNQYLDVFESQCDHSMRLVLALLQCPCGCDVPMDRKQQQQQD